jgi:uncharacterized protein involved in propanediol utilization
MNKKRISALTALVVALIAPIVITLLTPQVLAAANSTVSIPGDLVADAGRDALAVYRLKTDNQLAALADVSPASLALILIELAIVIVLGFLLGREEPQPPNRPPAQRRTPAAVVWVAAHCGECLQVFALSAGKAVLHVVSLPCGNRGAVAKVWPRPDAEIEVEGLPGWAHAAVVVAADAARCIAGRPKSGFDLHLLVNVCPGKGMGFSSLIRTATAKAIWKALDYSFEDSDVLEVVRRSGDSGVDSTVLYGSVVMASREFRVLSRHPMPLPDFVCMAVDLHPNGGVTTATAWLAPPTCPLDIACGNFLNDVVCGAVARNDHCLVARVATASAEFSLREVPEPALNGIIEIGLVTGALGVFRAHTGTVAGLLFDPADPELERKLAVSKRELARLDYTPWVFPTRPSSGGASKEVSDVEFPLAA